MTERQSALKKVENFANPTKIQTVYRNTHQKNFTILGNETLRARIPGDKLTAKDVWIDALTCEKGWYMSRKTLAKRHGVTERVMGGLLTRLSKSGYAKHIKIIDSKTNQIIKHQWVFYETPREPQHENGYSGSNNENQHEYCDNTPKSHDTQNGVVAPYIDQDSYNKQHSEITTTPQPEPPPEKPPEPPPEKPPAAVAAAVENFRKQLPPEINFRINNAGIRTIVGISDDHIKWAAREAMQSRYTEIKRKIGLFISLCKQEMPPTPSPPSPMEYNSDNGNHGDNHDAYKNLCDINFGEHESKIREYCNKIKRLPKERGVCFPPLGLCKAAMQGGATSITILRALEKTINNWDNIKDNPNGYFEEQCDKEKN